MSIHLQLYYPKLGNTALGAALARILGERVAVTEDATAPLRLDRLKCFLIRFRGSLMFSRAPFVYPLMDAAYHKYYLTDRGLPPELAAGADWVFLGGDISRFCVKLLQHIEHNRVRRVTLRPFDGVEGILPETRQNGDTPLQLVKQPCFHNDRQVKQHKEILLSTKPEEWGRISYPLVIDRFETVAPHIRAHLAAPPRSIIELGCGLGNTTRRLALEYPDAHVIGYDFSRDSIEVCRRTHVLPNLEFRVGDFTQPLPHEDASVDLIVSIEATNMSAAPLTTAGECCRVLSQDGLLVNSSLSESSYAYWDFPASLFLPVHMNTFATDWFAMARQAGLGFRLQPWQLMSFTFLACRNKEFHKAHHRFLAERNGETLYRLYHDRFLMLVGRHIPSQEPEGPHAHLRERCYPAYVRGCLAAFDPADAELARFTEWSRRLVDEELGLLPGGREFVDAVLHPHCNSEAAHV